jgi:PEGA domain-containing protein
MGIRKAFLLCAVSAALLYGCAESVAIKSYPPGAKAYIDGQFVGTTPVSTQFPRDQVTPEHTWRVEFRNCDPTEGKLATRVAPGRIVGYVFTLGILAAFRGPYYFPVVDTALSGGDCETLHNRSGTVAPAAGITVNQIVGDRNQAGSNGQEATKTQRLAERLTTLRDLYNRKLISQEIYERESQKAVRDLGE